ncbi:hypothetical protein BGW37DRAFT_493428 [Umbelopsis sp. PMI_123]|nr:hypothetical protein BGW37DRAFT_493428 [Umbelopsis sp. PMI_123]
MPVLFVFVFIFSGFPARLCLYAVCNLAYPLGTSLHLTKFNLFNRNQPFTTTTSITGPCTTQALAIPTHYSR